MGGHCAGRALLVHPRHGRHGRRRAEHGRRAVDYNEIVYGFFDRFLKGEQASRLDSLPKVTYFTMGTNKWQTADTWPPAGAQPLTFYLASGGKANT